VRGSERRIHWTRWLWIPIVIPALILAWLAWRAVASERELYHAELVSANQRLVGQLVGSLDARLQIVQDTLAAHMQEWGGDADSVWSDSSGIVLLGLRRGENGYRLLHTQGECREPVPVPIEPGNGDPMERIQAELLGTIHAHCLVQIDTLRLMSLESQASREWGYAPEWRPLMESLFRSAWARAHETSLWMRDSSRLQGMLETAPRGMLVQPGVSGLAMSLREPLVPRGNAVLVLLDAPRLMDKVLKGPRTALSSGGAQTLWGWKAPGCPWQAYGGGRLSGEPMAVGTLSRMEGWEIGVWPETGELKDAARGRTVLLSLVLVLSLGVLLFTAWAAASAVDAQRQLLALKTDFVSNVTHELKTPLTSILMFAELLESGKALPRAQEFGGVIRKEAVRLGALIEGILSVARQEAGMGRPEHSEVELRGMTEELLRSLEPQAASKGVRLMACGDGPLKVRTDAGLLRSILQNLVDNAIKYGSSPGKVQVELLRERGEIRISVLDDGPGIPPEDQRKVFDRFFRGGSGLTRTISGTGLGLSIVRSAVSSLGGKLKLESSVEWGTRVTVTIPEGGPGNG
jgi:signal transduction histidine kinase